MKNILIWGVSRSGKSTLARLVKKDTGHSIIELDHLRCAYQAMFPKTNDKDTNATLRLQDMLAKLLSSICHSNETDEYWIIEGIDMNMENLLQRIDRDKFVIVCLGYEYITPEEKLAEVKQYQTKYCWTRLHSDNEKLDFCKAWIKDSNLIKETAKRFDLKYFDTSLNRDKVLAEALKWIKNQLVR